MASEIRVNSLSSRTGLSTVTFTDTGPIFSGITTFQDNSGFNVGTGGSIFSPASNTVTLGTNNAERLRITSGGNLQVKGGNLHLDSNAELALFEDNTSGSYTNSAKIAFDFSGNIARMRSSTNGSATIKPLAFYIAYTAAIFIGTDGKVGINETSPTARLEVKSTGATAVFNSGAANDGRLEFEYNSSRVGLLAYHSDRLEIQTDSSKDFTIRTNGANERLRITSAGNIGVGGATGTDYSLLDGIVTNTANGSAGLLINSSSSSHNAYLGFSYGSGSSTSHADQFSAYIGRVGDNTLILGTDNNIRVRIDPSGHLLHGVSSDEDTSGNGGLGFINSGDIQIDGDQKASLDQLIIHGQLQSAIEWWNENGAGVQSKMLRDRTAVSQKH